MDRDQFPYDHGIEDKGPPLQKGSKVVGLGGKGGGWGGGLFSLGNNQLLPKDSSFVFLCSPPLVEVLAVFYNELA